MIFAPFAFQNQVITSSSGIVTDGLIYYVDAGNTTSYAGSGTTWYDLSGQGRTTTLYNGPTFDSANSGSINFDGSNDYAQIATGFNPNLTTKTMIAWCKLKSITQQGGGLIGAGKNMGSSDSFDAIVYNETNEGWGFGSDYFDRTFWTGVKETSTNDWVMITGVYATGSNGYKMYRQNQLIGTGSESVLSIDHANSGFWLGKRFETSTGPLNAYISVGMIYNRALSAAEIDQNFDAFKDRYGLSNPTIDTGSLKIWYDVGNPACYNGSTTLNNLVTGGTFSTATQANTGSGTITIDSGSRSVEFNKTTSASALNYNYQNVGSITRSSGLTYWGFIKKNSGANYGAQWCFLNDYTNSKVANLLIETTTRDGVRSEYNTGASGYVTVWNAKTMNVGTWYFVAYTVNVNASATITMLQSDDTTATSSTFNNSSPSAFTPTIAGFGITDAIAGTFNWSIGAHGVYEKTMTATEMRAIRAAYTSLGYYV